MEAPIFASAKVKEGAAGYSVQHGDDKALIVQFYLEAVRQGAASEKEGREIFKDVPYIWIRFAGDRTREIKRPVDMVGKNGCPPDPERFPNAWMAFQRQQEVVHEGTPLESWTVLGRSGALNLKSLNIHTVEQLAAVHDGVLHNLGTGGMELRDKAQAWLAAAKDSAAVMQLQAKLDKEREEKALLAAQLKELSERLAKVEAKKKD